MKDDDVLYMAMLHELKNNLALLTMTLENVPHSGEAVHDEPLDRARLVCQRIAERLTQTLLIYKARHGGIVLNAVDAHAPADLVEALAIAARSLKVGLTVTTEVEPDVPAIWFFDRNMVEMALTNAIHNSIAYGRSHIQIAAGLRDGMLAVSIHDDSDGYPEHILTATAEGRPLKAAGTGLGLHFARLIAQAHRNGDRHGELRLYNDRGAVFELRVP